MEAAAIVNVEGFRKKVIYANCSNQQHYPFALVTMVALLVLLSLLADDTYG